MSDSTLYEGPEFGLTVMQTDGRGGRGAGWRVHLPHQCDEWDIAGDYMAGDPWDVAVARLEEFIAVATAALVALRAAGDTAPRPEDAA